MKGQQSQRRRHIIVLVGDYNIGPWVGLLVLKEQFIPSLSLVLFVEYTSLPKRIFENNSHLEKSFFSGAPAA